MADKNNKGTASNLIKQQWEAVKNKDKEERIKLGKKIEESIGPYKESGKIGDRIQQKEKLSKKIKDRDTSEKVKRKRLKEVEKGTHRHLSTQKAIDMAEADVERDLPTSSTSSEEKTGYSSGGLVKGFPKLAKKGWKKG